MRALIDLVGVDRIVAGTDYPQGMSVKQPVDFVGKRLDAFVTGWGTGGTLTGAGEIIRKARPEVRIVATEKNYSQGSFTTTGNSLDVAVNGRGFFQVLMPDGTFGYTRDGSFKMSATGELVTSNGYKVQPGITIPTNAQSVTIGTDGVVSALLPGTTAPATIGTLQLTDFVNAAGLQPRGENLLSETASSGPAQTGNPGISGLGSLQQGSLEGSNVNVVEELVNMIETQRAYEMNSKAISTTDQMLQYASQNL